MLGSNLGVHARACGSAGWGTRTTAPGLKRHQATTASAASSQPASVHIGPLSAAEARTDRQSQHAQQSLAAFVKAKAFSGAKPGYAFKKGSKGVGYYLEEGAQGLPANKPQQQKGSKVLQGRSAVLGQQQQREEAGEEEEAAALSDGDMQPVKGVQPEKATHKRF